MTAIHTVDDPNWADQTLAELEDWHAFEENYSDPDDEDDDVDGRDVYDDVDSLSDVYGRAFSHFGDHELAREATELYPGDFI